jgi:hypothetical protein
MKKQHAIKVLLAFTALIGAALPSHSDVKINEGNGVNITMENDAMKLNIAVEGGGRISSLIDKKSNKDAVTQWKSPLEDGGLLDDRNVFTAAAYGAAVMQPGGKSGTVRLSAKNANGMEMVKILTLKDDSSALQVSETFSNGTQKPARFMIRNFMLPDGGPRTDDYQYFIPQKDKPLQALTPASNYFDHFSSPWSAVWNKSTGNGILVAAPGINQFYFWQESKIFPTYEWIYPEVPAGKSITVHYAIQLVDNPSPDWPELGAAALKSLRGVQFADVPGWQNEEQRYHVTDAERARGFWLSTGEGEGKRRLPPLRIDAPLNQARSVYIAINALKDLTDGDLQVSLQHIPPGLVQTAWQVNSKDAMEVLSFSNNQKITVTNGTEGRLWLTLQGGDKAQDAKGQMEISVNGQKVLLPLEVKVWPVRVPAQQPFSIHDYAGLISFFGGYKLGPDSLKQADTLFRHFHAIGGDTMNWTLNWAMFYGYLKIAGGDQTVADWVKKNRAEYLQKPAALWPDIDFSYFDSYTAAAKANSVTLAMTYLGSSTEKRPVTAENEWILIQLKKYLQTQGFHGFICKIADEIPAEDIPAYIESARIARRAGWHPFTTVTGGIARTAATINTMNPYADLWEVGGGSTEFFHDLLTQKYRLEEKALTLPVQKWSGYTNGGAKDTGAVKLFKNLIPLPRSEVQSLEVFQDGKPLQSFGGSPWGNQKRGVFFGGSDYLYLSPLEGSDGSKSIFTVKYSARVASDAGETLASIDPADQVWFYGGGSRTYKNTYGQAATYPLKALYGNYGGYGLYDFYRWNVDKVLWYDKATDSVTISPAYIGYRDGWNDACLLAWLAEDKKIPVSTFISEKTDAPLRIGEVQQEVYRWKNIVNITDPFVLNEAREKMLKAAG